MTRAKSHVFPRGKAALPTAVAGDGVWVIDSEGRRYLDACGGAAVSCLGHSDKSVVDAIKDQLDKLPYAHSSFFTTDAAETLADKLVDKAPEGIDRVYILSGGSEVVESAIKLARQYFLEIGQPKRSQVIARWQSYHGNTLGALSAGGNRWRRTPFEPLLVPAMHHIAPCHAYRWKEAGESNAEYGRRVADELEAKILELGPDTVAAFIAEPVVGATMGAVPAVEGYYTRIREICDKYGVLLILDEIMCGMGRTGTLFACEQDNVRPDIITIAKGLGAGYQPISAMLCSATIYDAIEQGSGFFQHGHTYLGHPTASAGAVAVLDAIENRNLLANVRDKGAKLKEALTARFGNHPNIGDIRGRGLFLGLEIVADRGSKEPFDPAEKVNGRIKAAAMANGLMCYPMGGTVDGRTGDHILLAPPFIIDDDHVGEIVDRLGKAVDSVLSA
ncbi:MAG: aspartate aminotransferase family protein [Hyphomicrobiales bacterium]|nr:MAG: aspartate aminotransferase family protein [Hyphomicrobiales bacterium]